MSFRWGMLGLMAAGLSTGLAAEPAAGAAGAGVWAASGKEAGATTGYTGKVEILPFGAYHQITWQTTRGVWEGFGQFVDGTFVCAWGEPGWYGFTLYGLSGPGEMRGDLARRDAENKVFTGQSEILNRVGDRKPGEDEFSGRFRVTGVQREIGGASIDYVGLIQITPKDGYYQLEWWAIGKEGRNYWGVGFRVGNKLGVAWGGNNDHYGAAIYRPSGDKLNGVFLPNSQNVLGTETLTRAAAGKKVAVPSAPVHVQAWSSVPLRALKKGDAIEINRVEAEMCWGVGKVFALKGNQVQVQPANPDYPPDSEYAADSYEWMPVKQVRLSPPPANLEFAVGDLVEALWDGRWFQGVVTGLNKGNYRVDFPWGSGQEQWYKAAEARAPVRQSFRSWQPGDKLEYFFDYVWYPGVVREIRGPFVRIEDQEDPSWGRWTVPEAVRNR